MEPIQKSLTICVIVALSIANLFASRTATVFDQLSQESEVLEVTLETDLDALEALKKTDDKQPALFRYEREDGSTDEYLIKVKVRGKFRRKTCDFAPLMLKFPKKELARRGLADHNDIKLVTHCMDDPIMSKDQVIREYLAYRLYNEVTDASYRVQLVRITYRDSDSNKKMKRWGFLIEDTDEMAERVGGTEADILNCEVAEVNQEREDLMTAFQLMIGNQDYSVGFCRNVKLVEVKGKTESIPVPYDFDFSGMVDANYAIPNPDYGTVNMQDRIYIGRAGNQSLVRSVNMLRAKRDSFIGLIENCKLLGSYERKEVAKYVDSFFDIDSFHGLLTGQILPYGEEANAEAYHGTQLPTGQPTLTVPGK